MTPEQRARFWSRVDRSAGDGACWLWAGYIREDGYGRFMVDGAQLYPHRVAFEDTRGPILDGRPLDHLCRNRSCANPAHLEPVTTRENTVRGQLDRLGNRCPRGHERIPENTTRRPDGRRECRICAIASRRRRLDEAGVPA